MTDATAVNASRVLETELFSHVIACAEGNDDALRYACLIAWCLQQDGPIKEVGHAIDFVMRSDATGKSPRLEQGTLTPVAAKLVEECGRLLRTRSGWTMTEQMGDYAYWLGNRIGHLLI